MLVKNWVPLLECFHASSQCSLSCSQPCNRHSVIRRMHKYNHINTNSYELVRKNRQYKNGYDLKGEQETQSSPASAKKATEEGSPPCSPQIPTCTFTSLFKLDFSSNENFSWGKDSQLYLKAWSSSTASFRCYLDQLAHAFLVEHLISQQER